MSDPIWTGSICCKCSADGRAVSTYKKQVTSITINCLELQVLLRCLWQIPPRHRMSVNQVDYCQPKHSSLAVGCVSLWNQLLPNHSPPCLWSELRSHGEDGAGTFCCPFRAGRVLSLGLQILPLSGLHVQGPLHFITTLKFSCMKCFKVFLLLLLLLNIKGINGKEAELASLSFVWNLL